MRLNEANVRLSAGLLMLGAFLFQSSLVCLILQTLYALALSYYHRRTVRLLPPLIILLSVTLANLLQVNGLQLLSIFGLPITAGSLLIGVRKALTLIGLLYLSQFMIAGQPQLPGTLGKLLSLQFTYFHQITVRWKELDKSHLLQALDNLLLSFDEGKVTVQEEQETVEASRKSLFINLAHLLFFWLLFFLGRLPLFQCLERWAY